MVRRRKSQNIFPKQRSPRVQSLADLLHLWQRRVLTGNDLQLEIRNAIDAVEDPVQHQVVSTILASLRKRDV